MHLFYSSIALLSTYVFLFVFCFRFVCLLPLASFFFFKAMAPHLKMGVRAVVCGPTYKSLPLEELTKLAESVIATEQLQSYIEATVNTSKANYAVVSALQWLLWLLLRCISILLRLNYQIFIFSLRIRLSLLCATVMG